MNTLTSSIVIIAVISCIACCQAEGKIIFSVEEIRMLSYDEWDKIWDVIAVNNYSDKGVYQRLENEYLVSIGENFEQRNAKLQAANETVDLYTKIDKRKRLEIIGINQRWLKSDDLITDEFDKTWQLKLVEPDTS